jgi:hypothetical protein
LWHALNDHCLAQVAIEGNPGSKHRVGMGNEDWDPIAVSSIALRDEYDAYIGGIYSILTGSRVENDLVDFLARAETEQMALNRSPDQKLRRVSERLLELHVSFLDDA